MTESKETPSGALQKELQQMYARTEHWISDYEFFKDEFKFLVNLMDKYFVGAVLADEEGSKKLKDLATRLLLLDESREHIAALNRENLSYLARLVANKELFDPEECRDRQSDLESVHVDFLRKYRLIKKDVFDLVEQLLASVRSRKLIS